jgi:hypothetical protein
LCTRRFRGNGMDAAAGAGALPAESLECVIGAGR